MSLKALHIIFIVASALVLGFFAVWCFLEYARLGEMLYLAGGIGGGVAVVGLIGYGRYVLRKLKHISYL